MQHTDALDGGGTVAADQAGNVFVAWHAAALRSTSGEENRKVWLARSTDDGKTFTKEYAINTKPTGACGCCGMRAFVDSKGAAYFLYRTAVKGNQRDIFLLNSTDSGKSFTGALVHPWEINACPMSSLTFVEARDGVIAAWDTDGQVYWTRVKSGTCEIGDVVAAPGDGKGRKHPALAVNRDGEMLLAWTEGTGWQRGGGLAWQVLDKSRKPTPRRGRLANAIPVWGLPAAIASPDGTFTVFH
jgi:hypothetical protein